MKPAPLFLLQLGLAVVGLAIYHLARPARAEAPPPASPAPGTAAPEEPAAAADPVAAQRAAELDGFDRRLAAIETGIDQMQRDLADVRVVASAGAPKAELLSDERLAVLDAQVTVIEARQLVERRTHNLYISVRELKQGLTPVEERMVVEILQRSHAEIGAFAKKLREAKPYDPQKDIEGHDELRKRYHEELRDLLTSEQAEAIIQRFLALR